ncbi:hypothetical protein ILYODFUR_031844 [Ilyodon furcidens]|uniref:Uncharacterized protein n=1 Tax=Ilyodon furcidens TaxID=33524 RepID=A0ABV0SS71_9TELE
MHHTNKLPHPANVNTLVLQVVMMKRRLKVCSLLESSELRALLGIQRSFVTRIRMEATLVTKDPFLHRLQSKPLQKTAKHKVVRGFGDKYSTTCTLSPTLGAT